MKNWSIYSEGNWESLTKNTFSEDVFRISREQEEFIEMLYNYASHKLEYGKEYFLQYKDGTEERELYITTDNIMEMTDSILMYGEYTKGYQTILRTIRIFVKDRIYPFEKWDEL